MLLANPHSTTHHLLPPWRRVGDRAVYPRTTVQGKAPAIVQNRSVRPTARHGEGCRAAPWEGEELPLPLWRVCAARTPLSSGTGTLPTPARSSAHESGKTLPRPTNGRPTTKVTRVGGDHPFRSRRQPHATQGGTSLRTEREQNGTDSVTSLPLQYKSTLAMILPQVHLR